MLDPQRILSPEEQAMFRLRELYRRHGYLPYKMSKFEEYDLYVRNKSFLASDRVLTFTDTDGKLMALKPDVTLSIVKNTRDTGGFQKVYYHENVYRPSPTSYGYREIPQAGLECIGPLDLAATAEVVMLAARSLESIDPGYLLDLSHLGLTAGLLAPLDLEEEQERAVLRALEAKNTSALRQLGAAAGVPGELTEALCRLALLYGRPSAALPALAGLTAGRPQAEAALGELRDLCALLGQYGLEDRLRLDFSLVNDQNYYSGIVFRGFLPGIASAVLSGGRYDGLLRRMGRQGGAIGFAVYLDQLERFSGGPEGPDADVLLLYDDDTDPAAMAGAANALLAAGKTARTDRRVPEGLRFGEIRNLRKEGQVWS